MSRLILSLLLLGLSANAGAVEIQSHIMIKQPGNKSVTYALVPNGGTLTACRGTIPVQIYRNIRSEGGITYVDVTIRALERVYFNFGCDIPTGFHTADCDFYMPGFWYHQNLRSPAEAPSFHTSRSWTVREDRLSCPLSGVFDAKDGNALTVLRTADSSEDAFAANGEGEVILSGNTSVGYVGFNNESDSARLCFGYPYVETPKRYIRKLTLSPAVYAFVKMEKGESKTIRWQIRESRASDYGQFVADSWNYCFDTYHPMPLEQMFTAEEVKGQLTNYFRESFVDKYPLKFNSGITLLTDDCRPAAEMQIGFCGRVLLNAFNEIEYGEEHGERDLVDMGNRIFRSFLDNGFTPKGYFHDHAWYDRSVPYTDCHSIRQQAEAVYAVLHFLKYEKDHGRRHHDWEKKVRTLLDNFIALQKPDGSYARKFHDDGSDIDAGGGSTPSATVPLVMAYKYYGEKKYLAAARRTVDYLETNIISRSDYFSSTLDANCEDKEAAISAVTATYYMSLVSTGNARKHYMALCRKSAYFALSWYYLWDVPFAQGQMLGDLGFKSRGWGNVSVENNHVDVFVFEFPSIMKWLGQNMHEKRFLDMYDVIYSSLSQLLPVKGRMCGIAKTGFYPEVVQHTTWDYGRNGKGFYNNYFAPGWTVASLWELYSPGRTHRFFCE